MARVTIDSSVLCSDLDDVRLRGALDALATAALDSGTTTEFLQAFVALAADLAGAQIAAARTCEGHEHRWPEPSASTAADGRAVWAAVDTALAIEATDPDPVRGASMRLHRWVLRDGEAPVGVLCLGLRQDRELSSAEGEWLALLSVKAGRAIARQLDRERLDRRIRARDDALTTVAHELRNPVNVIVLSANYLLERANDAPTRRAVERIVHGAQRADRLIQDLLDLNAVEKGRFSIDARSVDIAELVLSALESQHSLAATASVILGSDLAPELSRVRCDPERILEVLENLIGNAIKFTKPGDTVTLGASLRVDEVVLWVRDTGAGIPDEHIPRLFDRFWQGNAADRRGAGLGLAICKAIVDAHGGRIWAESRVGDGTTIHFTLPAEKPLAARPTEIEKILVVDDRPENLMAMRAILERPDYAITTASSGQEALRLALRERFAVALIDVKMPDMSGIDVALHMKQVERTREIPIVFVTAFGTDAAEIHRAYDAGCADYLVKPLDPEIVRKKVAFFVELKRSRQARTGA